MQYWGRTFSLQQGREWHMLTYRAQFLISRIFLILTINATMKELKIKIKFIIYYEFFPGWYAGLSQESFPDILLLHIAFPCSTDQEGHHNQWE